MSNQLEKIKELIERRAVARIGGGEKQLRSNTKREIHSTRASGYAA